MKKLHGHFLAQVNLEVMTGQRGDRFEKSFWVLAADRVELESMFRHHSLPLVTANRMMYDMNILGQNIKMT